MLPPDMGYLEVLMDDESAKSVSFGYHHLNLEASDLIYNDD